MNSGQTKTSISKQNLPEHVAIIMDGNGRWAKKRSLPRLAGHHEGIRSVREITRICGEIGIKHLTLYTFSTENWSRPKTEVSALMTLLFRTISDEVESLNKNNVKLSTIGDLSTLPDKARTGIENGIRLTQNNTGLNLILALSYGGRQEILHAVKSISKKVKSGEISADQMTEDFFSRHLYTADTPDPDLLIRTGGEFRMSNFLLWQAAYTELYTSNVFWPDFREKELLEALQEYQRRERRFGLTSEQTVGKP